MCAVADGHHNVSTPIKEFINELGAVSRDINPDLFHHSHRKRVHFPDFSSCTPHIELVTVMCPQVSLRHLGAGGIVGTDEKHDHLLHINSMNSLVLVDLDPLTGVHIMHIFRDFTGMISTAFKVPGYKNIMGTAGDALRVFHHVGDTFAEDRLAQ
jgi:hypothetical protein